MPERPAGEFVGDLEGPVATVGADGTVEPLGSPWRVGWAVGAEDRWHVAAQEAAVRTRLVDDMPVVATAMKVPGGDVVQQVAAVTAGAGRGVVAEFVNETPVPVSLALAVTGSAKRAAVRGSQLLVGDLTAVELGRVPGGAAAVSDGQVWNEVRSGPPPGDCQASSRAGLAAAVAVLPLARNVPLRVCLPAGGGASVLGSPGQVAAGWEAMVARAASAELPDATAVRAWRRGIPASILAAGGAEPEAAARAAIVLDRVGLPDEADRARAVVADAVERSRPQPEVAVVVLRALASRRLRAGRDSGLAERAGPLVAAAGDRLDRLTLEQAAAVLGVEAPAAARDGHRLLIETPRDSAPGTATGDGLAAAVRDSITFGGDGLAGIEAALDCLAAEAPDHLVVLPALPGDWKGAPLDVRGLATRHGLLSFTVRWHGSRPALLWERVPPTHRPLSPVPLRCGLDQSWQSEAPAGEALLGPGNVA
ncbi:MAG: hypothetical protein F4Z34_01795 [Acidimicrobiaceae bacterium]|nr:hypothetical protein [Acidimicrobiaceae bacterium]